MPVSALTAEVMGAPTLPTASANEISNGSTPSVNEASSINAYAHSTCVAELASTYRSTASVTTSGAVARIHRVAVAPPMVPVTEPAGSLGVKITAMYSPALAYFAAVMLTLRAERLESTSVHVVGAFPAPMPKA